MDRGLFCRVQIRLGRHFTSEPIYDLSAAVKDARRAAAHSVQVYILDESDHLVAQVSPEGFTLHKPTAAHPALVAALKAEFAQDRA